MLESTRRSTRRNNGKGRVSVGDLVELLHNDQIHQGRLVRRVQEGDTNSPWIVALDIDEDKSIEILEENIATVLARSGESDNIGPSKSSDSATLQLQAPKKKSLRTGTTGNSSGSDSDGNNKRNKRSTSVDFQTESNPSNPQAGTYSPDAESTKYSSSGEDNKVSSREERSRRRHLVIKEDVPSTSILMEVSPAPANKKLKMNAPDAVVKVPMLTGTLFLYRSPKRSVAFVRKV